MPEQSPPNSLVLSFGRFALTPSERLLTKDGIPIELGARALDTLIALASRPNEVVGKRELMSEVWPDVTVEEGSLRFHIAGLRKALDDGKDGNRYIATLAGRGYCFVAPVTRSLSIKVESEVKQQTSLRDTFLPGRLVRMVGREGSVRNITTELTASRFVTIVGPGGVGKTTVAVAVTHNLLQRFKGAVLFVDLSLLSDPRLVPTSVASMLGLSIQSDDPVPSLIAFLRERPMLVVLDNCEHVIEHSARFAAQLFLSAPEVHILATSREALRVEGERVYQLAPLQSPPEDASLTANETLSFPAARLFVDRVAATGAHIEPGDANAGIVAHICRKLGGMALAIELAAGRVGAYGLQQTAALLDDRHTLHWHGQRTAPARQKTLRATFDWSYKLLSEPERIVFRRLAVFVGSFTIEAALAIVTNEAMDASWVFAAIDSLVAKSMITAIPTGAMMRYRLLDAARAYALDIETDVEERASLAARHVAYYQRWLDQFASDGRPLFESARRASHLGEINNVRVALEWCFGDRGNISSGVRLAAAAAPVFFAVSLVVECQRWSQRAILALDERTLGSRQEMRVQAAFALASMWTNQSSDATFSAMNRSIEIATQLEDHLNQIILMAPLHVFHMMTGQFRKAMKYAEKVAEISRITDDPTAVELSEILLGYSLHYAGDLTPAQLELESALGRNRRDKRNYSQIATSEKMIIADAMGVPILALASSAAPSALARTLWMQGNSVMARDLINQTVAETGATGHSVMVLVALIYAISVMIWNGDFDDAGLQIERVITNAEKHELKSYIIVGRAFEGQLAISRGDYELGLSLLQSSLHQLHLIQYELMTTSFNISIVQALIEIGRFGDALSFVDATIESVETNGDFCYRPELLRLKAAILLRCSQPRHDLAEACLTESLTLSRLQGALAWELRTSIDMARHLANRGEPELAKALLSPVCDRFAHDARTADIQTAKDLLSAWS